MAGKVASFSHREWIELAEDSTDHSLSDRAFAQRAVLRSSRPKLSENEVSALSEEMLGRALMEVAARALKDPPAALVPAAAIRAAVRHEASVRAGEIAKVLAPIVETARSEARRAQEALLRSVEASPEPMLMTTTLTPNYSARAVGELEQVRELTASQGALIGDLGIALSDLALGQTVTNEELRSLRASTPSKWWTVAGVLIAVVALLITLATSLGIIPHLGATPTQEDSASSPALPSASPGASQAQ